MLLLYMGLTIPSDCPKILSYFDSRHAAYGGSVAVGDGEICGVRSDESHVQSVQVSGAGSLYVDDDVSFLVRGPVTLLDSAILYVERAEISADTVSVTVGASVNGIGSGGRGDGAFLEVTACT
jgi:hypothetical protein